MALVDHLKLALLLDGVAQVTITNISVNGQSGAQAVETLNGLAGKTPGSKRLEVSGNWTVRLNGLEFDFMTAVAVGSFHDIQIPVGSKSIISRGWFDTFGISQSVNSATEATCTFIGELNPPE